nr:tyrosine-protein phosphatase [Rhodococcus rhodochrous]
MAGRHARAPAVAARGRRTGRAHRPRPRRTLRPRVRRGRAAVRRSVVARAAGPVLVHCTAGKDRTGLAVAVLLLAAGVEPQAVVDDYVATDTNMPLLYRRWEAVGLRGGSSSDRDRAVPPDLFRAPAEAITPIVERLVAHPGGREAWLIGHGAREDDVRRWRSRARGEAAAAHRDRKAQTG